jgi:hypothetical protein
MMQLVRVAVAMLSCAIAFAAVAQNSGPPASKNLAPGFTTLPKGAKLVIMPTDMELFSISAGGVMEPKADWTQNASAYFKAALVRKIDSLGLTTTQLSEQEVDDLAEVNALHGAVARAISMHHFGTLALPTKAGKLDWSLGDAVAPIKKAADADYAIFTWVRDSYASGERKAAMFAMALLGVGLPGGSQTGYASLVDLNTGRVLWFNRLVRMSGDLREEQPATETLNALMGQFPAAK